MLLLTAVVILYFLLACRGGALKQVIRVAAFILLTLFVTGTMSAQTANLSVIHDKVQNQLQELAGQSRGAMAIAVLDLTSGERFNVNENLVFPQASAIKIAILMEVYKQANEGKFKLTDKRRIEKATKTGGSGILVELGDGTVELTIRDLCVLMIVLSDNTATNILIDLVGRENINKTMDSLGLKETRVRRRMMDTAASHRGDENTSTPREAVRIMELLHKGEFVNRAACDDILSILKKGKTTNLKGGLPEDVVLACKPGGIAGVQTEWAIVYLKDRPYAVAVMENFGMGDAPDLMKKISQTLYNYFLRLSKATSHGALVDKPGK